ncbi:efflux RND transporter permease subunit [Halodesulfovibrio spirochaetisodalis]|uniref:Acriflavin resistance protein n=1 Tax=Halodesulfovibrio spirochaetisodalis TaxID=1560234 RepID=A0A1B7XQ06_9BACT|nr:efflux RND transporter permease subunit [Halodesulfovibrio spirochaetisodalis]OBQ57604.1 hypothetical protein SP90_00720 [Halodesulfovibrio spirochaetisodalis]
MDSKEKQKLHEQNMNNSADDPDHYSAFFKFFISKTTFSILFLFTLVIGGIFGYTHMIKESFPDLSIPQAVVTTEWAGASPEIIEKEITNKIEKKLKSLKGLKSLRSGSRRNFSSITVEFQADEIMSEAMALLRAKVSEAEADLPSEAKKPKITEVAVSDTPIATFMIYGNVDPARMGTVARDLKRKFERINGIREAQLSGDRKEIVRIQLKPARMRALALSATTVRDAITSASRDMPLGQIEDNSASWSVNLTARFESLDDLRNVPVKRLTNGRTIRLHEVAEVSRNLDKEINRCLLSWSGGNFLQGISIGIIKVSGRDTLALIKKAEAVIKKATQAPDWPNSLQYAIVSNESSTITNQLSSMISNGWQAMVAVFLVLLFMLTWREALIAGLSIPITFLGSVAIVALLGNTMNMIVIIGMVLALGMLVDVFILVMEGMHEAIFIKKLGFLPAAHSTIKTYAMPAFAGQMTTVLAMTPLLAIRGLDGKFIRLIPITTITCLLLSFVVAFLVSIPLSRFLLGKGNLNTTKTAVDNLTERISASFKAWLLIGPAASKKKAAAWVAGAFALFILSLNLAGYLPSEMYPKDDGLNMGVFIRLAPGTDLEQSQKLASEVGATLKDTSFLESVTMFVGKKSPFSGGSLQDSLLPTESTNFIGFSLRFLPKKERNKLAYEYQPELRARINSVLSKHPGTELFLKAEVGGSTGAAPVQIELTGTEIKKLRTIANDVKSALRNVQGTSDVADNLGPAEDQLRTTPRREALNFYRVQLDDVINQVRIALENDKIGSYKLPGVKEDLDIKLSTLWASREGKIGSPRTAEELHFLSVTNDSGISIPVSSLLTFDPEEASQVILHRNNRRTVSVTAKTNGVTASQILQAVQPKLETMEQTWPSGYSWSFSGEAESTSEVYSSVPMVLTLALFLVFSVLALLFGSFMQPIIIMLTVPLALTGTFIGFFLFNMPLSFPAIIGIISLAGIVVNNAIVMIETMNEVRQKGASISEAASAGASERLRPIISTTVTTLIGLIPLAISSPFWMPLCLAIIFGLTVATIMALVVIPCLYKLITHEKTLSA